MAAIDASKPVAKALEILRSISEMSLNEAHFENVDKISESIRLLEEAIEKICEEQK